jgi:hypothetical protein
VNVTQRDLFEDLPILGEIREGLEQLLVVAAPVRRRRARLVDWLRGRARPLVVVAGVLVAGGSATAAVSLLGQPSKPLVGIVPGTPVPYSQSGGGFVEAGQRYRVIVAPNLTAGFAGWAGYVGFVQFGHLASSGGGGGYPTSSTPILLAGPYSTPIVMGKPAGDVVDYVLAGPNVAAIRVGSTVIATRTSAQLPAGDRVAVFFVPPGSPPVVVPPPGARLPYYQLIPTFPRVVGNAPHERQGATGLSFQPGPKPRMVRTLTIAVVALDRAGQVLPTRSPAMSFLSATRFWQVPSPSNPHPGGASHPLSGACELAAHGLPTLTPEWGNIATTVQPVVGAEGELLLSCNSTEYYLDNWPLEAAVLVNAQHPGRPVGPIPGATRVPGHPGVVNVVLGNPPGDITARRVGNAWLVVEGARNLAQRLRVLDALRIARLSLAAAPASAAQRRATRVNACLERTHYTIAAGPAPFDGAYTLAVSAGQHEDAQINVYATTRSAADHQSMATRGLPHPGGINRLGPVTVIWLSRTTATVRAAINRCAW